MLLELETCSQRQSWSFTESTVTNSPSLASSSQRRRGRHLKVKGATQLQIKAALEIAVLMCFSVLFSRITCWCTGAHGQTQFYMLGQKTHCKADGKVCTLPARRQGILQEQRAAHGQFCVQTHQSDTSLHLTWERSQKCYFWKTVCKERTYKDRRQWFL